MTNNLQSKLHKCSCGAYGIDDGTKEVKFAYGLENFNKYTGLNLTESDFEKCPIEYGCNHCVNHWGMDICQCGSGESVADCDCQCGLPSQTYNKKEKRALWVF